MPTRLGPKIHAHHQPALHTKNLTLPIPLVYKGEPLDACYRVDLIVEGLVVVELKAVDHVLPVHQAQVLTYLRMTECPLGLLMNFNVAKLTDGVIRLVNPKRRVFKGAEIDSGI